MVGSGLEIFVEVVLKACAIGILSSQPQRLSTGPSSQALKAPIASVSRSTVESGQVSLVAKALLVPRGALERRGSSA